jgi:hypothetical protein
VGKVTRVEGENTDVKEREGTLCSYGEPFLTGTKGYLPQHSPGRS